MNEREKEREIMRAVFSDGNRMVSELHWHPNKENCFLWQTLNISLTLSLTLSLCHSLSEEPKLHSCTHPVLPSFLSFRNSDSLLLPQTQTRCAKGVISVTEFQKVGNDHEEKQNNRQGKNKIMKPCRSIKRLMII